MGVQKSAGGAEGWRDRGTEQRRPLCVEPTQAVASWDSTAVNAIKTVL